VRAVEFIWIFFIPRNHKGRLKGRKYRDNLQKEKWQLPRIFEEAANVKKLWKNIWRKKMSFCKGKKAIATPVFEEPLNVEDRCNLYHQLNKPTCINASFKQGDVSDCGWHPETLLRGA
jgi:hypothetical protein